MRAAAAAAADFPFCHLWKYIKRITHRVTIKYHNINAYTTNGRPCSGQAENIICIKNIVWLIFHPHHHHHHTPPDYHPEWEVFFFLHDCNDARCLFARLHTLSGVHCNGRGKNNFSNFFRSHDDKIDIPFNFLCNLELSETMNHSVLHISEARTVSIEQFTKWMQKKEEEICNNVWINVKCD